MMQIKYEVGQTVLLKVKVQNIVVDNTGINYSVIIPGKKNAVKVSESYIDGAAEETFIDGNKIR